jgi:hypothetical protein
MWKEVAFVAGAAALGEYAARQWGSSIETKAIEMKVPVAVAHALVVGSFAAAGFAVAKALL